MKSVKISHIIIIIIFTSSSLLINYFMLYAYQSGELINTQAFNETLYNKSQSYPENNNSSTLIFSNPFYLSNATLMLSKIPIEKSSVIDREVQFFVERGVINTSLVTYNVGYYVEDSNMNGSTSDSKPLNIDFKAEIVPNYAKGSGFFLTENGGIIEWDAFDQIIDKSDDKVLYAGMMFFSPATVLLLTRMMKYHFSKIEWDYMNFLSTTLTTLQLLPLILHSLLLLLLLLLPPIERYGSGPIPTNQYQGLSREKLDS